GRALRAGQSPRALQTDRARRALRHVDRTGFAARADETLRTRRTGRTRRTLRTGRAVETVRRHQRPRGAVVGGRRDVRILAQRDVRRAAVLHDVVDGVLGRRRPHVAPAHVALPPEQRLTGAAARAAVVVDEPDLALVRTAAR